MHRAYYHRVSVCQIPQTWDGEHEAGWVVEWFAKVRHVHEDVARNPHEIGSVADAAPCRGRRECPHGGDHTLPALYAEKNGLVRNRASPVANCPCLALKSWRRRLVNPVVE